MYKVSYGSKTCFLFCNKNILPICSSLEGCIVLRAVIGLWMVSVDKLKPATHRRPSAEQRNFRASNGAPSNNRKRRATRAAVYK